MSRTALGLIFCAALLSAPSGAEVLYEVDFEAGDIQANIGSTSDEQMGGGTIEAVANPQPDQVNGSALVGRCQIPHGYTRAELSSQRLVTEGQTYRYKWSYFIPDDFFDDADITWLVNSQWKTWPCEVCNPVYDPAICGSCAGIFNDLRITDGLTWDFWWRAEPDCHEHSENIITGQWVSFEMLIYWTKDSTGYFRLWRDGVLIDSRDDIQTLFSSHESGTCDMYWAVGLYAQWTGTKETLEIYIDNIEISNDVTTQPDGGTDADGDDGTTDDGDTDEDGGTDGDDGAVEDGGTDGQDGTDEDDLLVAQCIETYGTVAEFELCHATQSSCSFNAFKGSNQSCTEVCEAHGGQCLTVFANSTGDPCSSAEELSCDLTDHVDDICVCSLPESTDGGDQDDPADGDSPDGGDQDHPADGSSSDGDGQGAQDADDSIGGGCNCTTRAGSPTTLLGMLFLCLAIFRFRKRP